jgi:hypothetical protein
MGVDTYARLNNKGIPIDTRQYVILPTASLRDLTHKARKPDQSEGKKLKSGEQTIEIANILMISIMHMTAAKRVSTPNF